MHRGFGQPASYAYPDTRACSDGRAFVDALTVADFYANDVSDGIAYTYSVPDTISHAHPGAGGVIPAFHPD